MPLTLIAFRIEEDDLARVQEASSQYYPQGISGNRSQMLRDIIHQWVLQQFHQGKEHFLRTEDGRMARVLTRGFDVEQVEVVGG